MAYGGSYQPVPTGKMSTALAKPPIPSASTPPIPSASTAQAPRTAQLPAVKSTIGKGERGTMRAIEARKRRMRTPGNRYGSSNVPFTRRLPGANSRAMFD